MPGTTLAVEYFNASLEHYFLTVTPLEMAVLDKEGPAGWQRTGLSFWVYPADSSARRAARARCADTTGDPKPDSIRTSTRHRPTNVAPSPSGRLAAWILESPTYFYAYLQTSIGSCPADAAAQRAIARRLYRVYNNRPDANHRFTTSYYLAGADAVVARLDAGRLRAGFDRDVPAAVARIAACRSDARA